MDDVNVLKLDSSFKPVEVISWEEAVVLTWLKKAWAAEYTDKWAHSAKKAFQIPSVIVLFRYIDEKFFEVSCVRKITIKEIETSSGLRNHKVCG